MAMSRFLAAGSRQCWRHMLLYTACATLCVAIGLLEGKDFNWDLQNYHIYGPWALLNGRYGQDFMAGGPQGYLNPIAHFPLYWMVISGIDDRLIIATLSIIHASCLYLTCLIAFELFRGESKHERLLLMLASGILAAASPIFWSLTGNTFTDPFIATLMLVSLYAVLLAPRCNKIVWIFSGIAFGSAAALKLTTLIFAPPMAIAIILGLKKNAVTSCAIWLTGFLIGFLALALPSALPLYFEFGNPFFPLFNSIFQSDFAPTHATAAHNRFVPDSFSEFALRPLRMLDSYSWIYFESRSPDARILLTIIAGVSFACISIWRKIAKPSSASHARESWAISTEQLQFWSFLLAGWIVWSLASGNGRYGYVLFLLAGPALVALVSRIKRKKLAFATLAAIVLLQSYFVASSFEHRWNKIEWMGKPFGILSDPSGTHKRAGYILDSVNSGSIAFPYLDAGSEYFAIAGQRPATWMPAVEQRLAEFKNRWRGNMRLLTTSVSPRASKFPTAIQQLLSLHGMKISISLPSHCERIEYHADNSSRKDASVLFLSCPISEASFDTRLARQRSSVSHVFDKVAAACRLWFPEGEDTPPYPKTGGWERRYDATDIRLFTSSDRIMFSRESFGPHGVDLGSINEWQSGKIPQVDCRPIPRHYATEGVVDFQAIE